MTATCAILADDMEERLGPRLREFLANESAKDLARKFGASISTAEKWKTGSIPATKHMAAMLNHWGDAFIAGVLSAVIDTPETIDQHARRIERDITALRREIENADLAADRGRVAELAGAARAERGGAAVSQGAADQRRTPMAGATRTLGTLICGLALGMGVANYSGALPTPEDEPTQIMRRAPRRPGSRRDGRSWLQEV